MVVAQNSGSRTTTTLYNGTNGDSQSDDTSGDGARGSIEYNFQVSIALTMQLSYGLAHNAGSASDGFANDDGRRGLSGDSIRTIFVRFRCFVRGQCRNGSIVGSRCRGIGWWDSVSLGL